MGVHLHARYTDAEADTRVAIHADAPAFEHFLHFLRARGHIHLLQFDDEEITDVPGTTTLGRETQHMYIVVANGATEVGRSYRPVNGLGRGSTSIHCLWGSKELFLQFEVLRHTAEANAISYIQLKAAVTEGDLVATGIGIKVADLALYGQCYGEGAFSGDLDMSTDLVHNQVMIIGIHHKPSEFVKWYANGVLVATEETDVPSVTANIKLVVSHKTTGNASADNYIQVFNPIIIQGM